MPENFWANVMAMCCGLSLAVALGWNVTAGAAEWRQLAETLCIVSPTDQDTAGRICRDTAVRTVDRPAYFVVLPP